MGKRTFGQSPRADQIRLEQGRGLGTGPDYRPWIETHHIPANSQVNRVFSPITGRNHHLLSQLELHVFYMVVWLPGVRDIREQYPLLPLEETTAIAAEIGVRHPIHPKSRDNVVMTSDFVITVETENGLVDKARAVKPSVKLDQPRVREKLEIERRYWERHGCEWGIVTEREVSPVLVRNAEFVMGYEDVNTLPVGPAEVMEADTVLRRLLRDNSECVLWELARTCDQKFGYEPGTGLAIVRHLIAARVWKLDMYRAIAPDAPLPIVDLTGWPQRTAEVDRYGITG